MSYEVSEDGGIIVPPEVAKGVELLLTAHLFDATEADLERVPKLRGFKNPRRAVYFGGAGLKIVDGQFEPFTDEDARQFGERYNSDTAVYDHATRWLWCDAKD